MTEQNESSNIIAAWDDICELDKSAFIAPNDNLLWHTAKKSFADTLLWDSTGRLSAAIAKSALTRYISEAALPLSEIIYSTGSIETVRKIDDFINSNLIDDAIASVETNIANRIEALCALSPEEMNVVKHKALSPRRIDKITDTLPHLEIDVYVPGNIENINALGDDITAVFSLDEAIRAVTARENGAWWFLINDGNRPKDAWFALFLKSNDALISASNRIPEKYPNQKAHMRSELMSTDGAHAVFPCRNVDTLVENGHTNLRELDTDNIIDLALIEFAVTNRFANTCVNTPVSTSATVAFRCLTDDEFYTENPLLQAHKDLIRHHVGTYAWVAENVLDNSLGRLLSDELNEEAGYICNHIGTKEEDQHPYINTFGEGFTVPAGMAFFDPIRYDGESGRSHEFIGTLTTICAAAYCTLRDDLKSYVESQALSHLEDRGAKAVRNWYQSLAFAKRCVFEEKAEKLYLESKSYGIDNIEDGPWSIRKNPDRDANIVFNALAGSALKHPDAIKPITSLLYDEEGLDDTMLETLKSITTYCTASNGHLLFDTMRYHISLTEKLDNDRPITAIVSFNPSSWRDIARELECAESDLPPLVRGWNHARGGDAPCSGNPILAMCDPATSIKTPFENGFSRNIAPKDAPTAFQWFLDYIDNADFTAAYITNNRTLAVQTRSRYNP